MDIKYFDFLTLTWTRLESDNDMSPTHRALFWAIVHKWNQKFFSAFEANRHELMKMSGIKSEKTYFTILQDLQKLNYVIFQRGNNQHIKSTLEVAYVNFAYVKSTYVKSTYVNITEAEGVGSVKFTEAEGVGSVKFTEAHIYSNTDLDNTDLIDTDLYMCADENFKKIKKEKKASKEDLKEVTFLESDVGAIETLTEYIQNSEAPDADAYFYFTAMRDWTDKKTGEPVKRKNWKLVFNTFIRNDISRYGKYKQSNSSSRSNIQAEYREIDKSIEQYLNIRSGVGQNGGAENDFI